MAEAASVIEQNGEEPGVRLGDAKAVERTRSFPVSSLSR